MLAEFLSGGSIVSVHGGVFVVRWVGRAESRQGRERLKKGCTHFACVCTAIPSENQNHLQNDFTGPPQRVVRNQPAVGQAAHTVISIALCDDAVN